MPGYLLDTSAMVMCMHAGQAQPVAPFPRVLLNKQPVTTVSAPYLVSACPFIVALVPSPCITAQWVSAATRVTAGGTPVLLQDGQAVCAPNGTGVNVVLTQLRVKGM